MDSPSGHTVERTGQKIANNTPPFQLGYRPGLDAIRGIAIILVMLYHTHPRGTSFLPNGYLGVDAFFVLSGFLITTLLVEEWRGMGRLDLPRFYARRALRLFPELLLLLIGLGLVTMAARYSGQLAYETTSGWALVASLAYVANFAAAWHWVDLGALIHTWSLAAEEQFYLLWPPILLLLLRRQLAGRRLAAVLILLAVASAIWGQVLWRATGDAARIGYAPDTRGAALLVGCALGIFLSSLSTMPSPRERRVLGFGAILAFLLLASWLIGASGPDLLVRLDERLGTTKTFFAAVATAVVIAWLVLTPPGASKPSLAVRPLLWVGRLSYGLYLWHVPVIWYGYIALGRLPVGVWVVTIYALIFFVTSVSYYGVERPCLQLKSRLRPRSTR